ncbi:MAG: type II secretion system F family protein [Planctomycetota bacterium]|jgi:tight adherence protein B
MQDIPHDIVATVTAGLAVGIFIYIGIELFRKGWQSYEERYVDGAEKTLDSMYLTMPAQQFIYLALLAAIVLFSLFFILTGQTVVALLFGFLGLGIPTLILKYMKNKRDDLFNYQLVDALMNISNSLKAGMTLPQAFEVLAREMPNPISQEFALLNQELRLGRKIDEALEHLLARMPSADLDLIVTAVIIVQDVGGNLTEVFDNIAHTIRERFRIEGKIKSLTAQGRMQAIVICSLPFLVGLGMHFTTPGVIAPLFNTVTGGFLIFISAVLMLLGIFVIKKIITIDI